MIQYENNDLTSWFKQIKSIEELSLAQVHCSICHKVESFNKSEYSDNQIVTLLVENNWAIINNKLYCAECRKQYKELSTIFTQCIQKDNSVIDERPSKINYYINIAKEVASRATCLRRKYGAVLIKNDTIISTGYNGSPRGTKNCIDIKECRREKLSIPRGQCYEMCRSIHAEQNCIINASRNDMIGASLYLYGLDVSTGKIIDNLDSCQLCKKMIINAGIDTVYFAKPNNQFRIQSVQEWILNDETLTDKFGY